MVKKILFGNEVEKMPDFAFRMMKIFFVIYYFFKPAGKYLRTFGIKPGNIIVDYGCGTGACIKDTDSFLKELNRITRNDGVLIIEDGHQPRTASKEKILKSGSWIIIREENRFLKCTPVRQNV